MDHYILENQVPKRVDDPMEWAEWFGTADRTVARTELHSPGSPAVVISTVFLGLDHQWGEGRPLLFETMTFTPGDSEGQWRYSTWDEAVEGHQAVVNSLRVGYKTPGAD